MIQTGMDRRVFGLGLLATPIGAAACASAPTAADDGIVQTPYGQTDLGEPVTLFTLTNHGGRRLQVMTWAAAVTSLLIPDRNGTLADVVLGLDSVADYQARSRNFGAAIGRYAGRIAGGRFELDDQIIQLDTGGGAHSSHGGPVGFGKRNWSAVASPSPEGPGVVMSLISADGDQGFPGEMTISVTYRLTHDDRFVLSFQAETTAATVLNPTHHGYFNLSGDPGSLILDHRLKIEADAFTAFGPDKIVTGELRPVLGTPFDFREPKLIGRDIAVDEEQMRIGAGYDHNFVIRGQTGVLRPAATLEHEASGRRMEMWTTEPGVQLYTANAVDMIGRNGAAYRPHCGLALEPQHFQNSPNRPEFPSTVLRPGQTFHSTTEYRFG